MTGTMLLMLISALSLPLLSILALLLRRDIFGKKWKFILLTVGLMLLIFSVVSTFYEHGEKLGLKDIFVGGITASITLFILSKFSHTHSHQKQEEGAKGIVLSEAFHSLIDGAVIGTTYLVNPVLGYAATVGIIIHELPKIVGTLAVLRGFGLSVQKTIWYGILAQIGSPIAAVLIFMLGKQINIEQLHGLEIASISSLGAIVLWIIYLEISFHKRHPHTHHENNDINSH